jgi:hypothetical protein
MITETKVDGKVVRLFQPDAVIRLMNQLEQRINPYQINVEVLLSNWQLLKGQLMWYAQAPKDEIEKSEQAQKK